MIVVPDRQLDSLHTEALLTAEALQRAIFTSANFSSIATDAKGVIQIFNVGAERMLGYTAADVMNRITPADLSDPQELIARANALSAELGTPIAPGFEALVFKASRGIEDIYELSYIRKDGGRVPAVVSVTALRDAAEMIIGYLLIGTDNTARKQIEEERKKLDQRFRDQQFYTRSLIEAHIDALVTTDPAGIITDVNTQMVALTGRTRDELIGTPFKDHFAAPAKAEAGIALVLREKKVANLELTARSRDGIETMVSLNATTFYDRDRVLQGVFAAARDVTERKRLDQLLHEKHIELEGARAVAEGASLAKSDFLSSMSHELRSPLNAIIGFAQLLETDTPPPTASQKASIDQVLQAGWYLLTLINEILDLAVIESGRMAISLEPVALAEVLAECEDMIAGQALQHGVTTHFPAPDRLLLVRADRTRLKQILLNLLSNAVKYNSISGTLTVTCMRPSPELVRISVRDTGAGLAPEQIADLFQPFNRLGQQGLGEEGTGIGLVVSKRLAEAMHGAIGVESAVGVGSTFWVDLRATVAKPEPSSAPSSTPSVLALAPALAPALTPALTPAPATPVRTLLYVEDNPANLMLIEQLVARRPDLRLISAGDAPLGIALARTERPDVILLDINLPGMNGFAALRILLADPITMNTPVMALSANAMPSDIARGMQAGFFRYLTKPVRVPDFFEALAEALDVASPRDLTVVPPSAAT